MNNDQYSYSADTDTLYIFASGQDCGRHPTWLRCDSFTIWADNKMLDDGWSPYMVVERATEDELFPVDLIPSTSTLYHWIICDIIKNKKNSFTK